MFSPFRTAPWFGMKVRRGLLNTSFVRAITFVNKSKHVKDADLAWMVKNVFQVQLDRDFTPVWDISAKLIADNSPAPGMETIVIADTSDQANALGYHERGPNEVPQGFVFIESTWADHGRWSTTASHELLEQLVDPWIISVVEGTMNGKPANIAYEVGDPVENDEYKIGPNTVSNFVTPSWFITDDPKPTGPTDFLNKLNGKSLAMTPGGYMSYAPTIGQWTQVQDKQHTAKFFTKKLCCFSRINKRITRACKQTGG